MQVLPLTAGKRTAVVGPHFNASWVLVQPDTGDTCPSGGLDCIPTPFDMISRYNLNGKLDTGPAAAGRDTLTQGAVGSFLLSVPPSPHVSPEQLLEEALALARASEQVRRNRCVGTGA